MYVYLLRESDERRFKIGWAVDIRRRLSAIGGPAAFRLDQSLCVPVATKRKAVQLERCLHILFDAFRCDAVEPRITGGTEFFRIECWDHVVQFLSDNSALTGVSRPGPLPCTANPDRSVAMAKPANGPLVEQRDRRVDDAATPPVTLSRDYHERKAARRRRDVAMAVTENQQRLSRLRQFVDVLKSGELEFKWFPRSKRHGYQLLALRLPQDSRGDETRAFLEKGGLLGNASFRVPGGGGNVCLGMTRRASLCLYHYSTEILEEGSFAELATKDAELAEQRDDMLKLLRSIPALYRAKFVNTACVAA